MGAVGCKLQHWSPCSHGTQSLHIPLPCPSVPPPSPPARQNLLCSCTCTCSCPLHTWYQNRSTVRSWIDPKSLLNSQCLVGRKGGGQQFIFLFLWGTLLWGAFLLWGTFL